MEQLNELRQMPEIQNIAAYLRDMTFRKKAFGGCDTESVFEHFSVVTQMYEAIICAYMQQVDQYARQLGELQARPGHREGEYAPPAPPPPGPPPWYGAPAPQPQPAPPPMPVQPPMPMQPPMPYAPQNPWAQPAYTPWAPPPAPSYYAPQPAWQDEPEGLPEPVFLRG